MPKLPRGELDLLFDDDPGNDSERNPAAGTFPGETLVTAEDSVRPIVVWERRCFTDSILDRFLFTVLGDVVSEPLEPWRVNEPRRTVAPMERVGVASECSSMSGRECRLPEFGPDDKIRRA